VKIGKVLVLKKSVFEKDFKINIKKILFFLKFEQIKKIIERPSMMLLSLTKFRGQPR
jgi:hypothetical protein